MASRGYTTESLVEAEIGTNITGTSVPTSSQLDQWIEETESLIDEKLGSIFTSGTATNVVQAFDEHTSFMTDNNLKVLIPGQDYYGATKSDSAYLTDSTGLRVLPILSITAFSRNISGADTSADSWESLTENTGSSGDFFVDKNTGLVQFQQNVPTYGRKRAFKWSGTYGYSSIPLRIKTLATKLVAQRALQMKVKKGMFSNTDSYSLEGFSKRKELGQNVTYLQDLDRELDRLWEQLSGAFQSEVVK